MAEGVAVAGNVAAGVYDDPDAPPPADPVAAPKGWTWRRSSSSWQPAQRRARGRGAVPDVSRETPEQDPAPSWAGDRGGGSSSSAAGPSSAGGDVVPFDEIPEQVKDDIAGLAGLVAVPILSLLQSIDPYCGAALADSLTPAVDAALPLICRSSRIVAYFADPRNDWILWGKLALALKPVGQAIVEHHVLGRVRIVRDPATGARLVERTGPRGVQGDPLQPPVHPEYQYAA